VAFTKNQNQWDRMRADQSLINSAIDQNLRRTTAVYYSVGAASKSNVLGGQKIVAGEALMMLRTSANGVEAEFGPTADPFDIGRTPPNHHVASGLGVQFCFGGAPARLQLAAKFEVLGAMCIALRLELPARVQVLPTLPELLGLVTRLLWNDAMQDHWHHHLPLILPTSPRPTLTGPNMVPGHCCCGPSLGDTAPPQGGSNRSPRDTPSYRSSSECSGRLTSGVAAVDPDDDTILVIIFRHRDQPI
jgi:hypothetical protein